MGAARVTDLTARARAWSRAEVEPGVNDPAPSARVLRQRIASAAAHGFLGVQVPQALGGLGLPFSAKLALGEALAQVDFGSAMAVLNTHNVAEQLARLWPQSTAAPWVRAIVSGERVACTALTEPEAPELTIEKLVGVYRVFIPHFIALSASSPFVQGQDTQFDSARLNSVFAFPMSGRAPFTLSWSEFEAFFAKTTRTGVVRSMKDFYWDIRPKPEFGTIEIRVFDTPLAIERAAALAGFVQSLAAWFLKEAPFVPAEDDYLVYTYNRFQACRFGLDAVYVEPSTGEHLPLRDHIALTLERVADHGMDLGADAGLALLADDAARGRNDARWLRESLSREQLLAETVRQAALRLRGAA